MPVARGYVRNTSLVGSGSLANDTVIENKIKSFVAKIPKRGGAVDNGQEMPTVVKKVGLNMRRKRVAEDMAQPQPIANEIVNGGFLGSNTKNEIAMVRGRGLAGAAKLHPDLAKLVAKLKAKTMPIVTKLSKPSGAGLAGAGLAGASSLEGGSFLSDFLSKAGIGKLPKVSLPEHNPVSEFIKREKNLANRGQKLRGGDASDVGVESIGGAVPILAPLKESSGNGKVRRAKAGPNDGRKKRAAIVSKVMKERGLSLIDASKYVKANNLY